MRFRQQQELPLTELREVQANDTMILGIDRTHQELCPLGSIDEADCAVMPQEEVLGNLADGRW